MKFAAILLLPVVLTLTNDPSITAPETAAPGTLVSFSGSSPSGESGTSIEVDDDLGPITLVSLTWNGTSFEGSFYMPSDIAPKSNVMISVTPESPHSSKKCKVKAT